MSIPRPALEAAIAALETHAQHPDTGAIHDPIYGMLTGDPGQVVALSQAIAANPTHPAASQLREILGDHLEIAEPTMAAVIARHGGMAQASPIEEVDRLLSEAVGARHVLSARVYDLESDNRALGKTANGMAAVAALIAVFGVIGWLVALGWLEIAWIEPAVPEHLEDAASGRGTVAPDQRRIR